MREIWRNIPGWFGYYQASNLGRIRSKNRILSCRSDKDGYLRLNLSTPKKRADGIKVHLLVLMAFRRKPKPGETVPS